MFYTMLAVNLSMAVGIILYNYSGVILDILLNGVNCSKIQREKVNNRYVYSINTDHGKLFLNYTKVPSDIDIFVFDEPHEFENQLMKKSDFNKLYSSHMTQHMTKNRDSLLTTYKTTYDLNGRDTISGYIDSYFEDHVYVFTIDKKTDSIIDFNALIDSYRSKCEQLDEEDSELSSSDIELIDSIYNHHKSSNTPTVEDPDTDLNDDASDKTD